MDDLCGNKLILYCLLLLLHIVPNYPFTEALPLCTDSRAPIKLKKALEFCPYNGTAVCCDETQDLQLRRRFQAMNISDVACASVVKSILCAACDQFSAELFKAKPETLPVPTLCNTTEEGSSSSKSQSDKSFCSYVWDSCNNIPILDSPFAPSLQTNVGTTQNATFSKLNDLWQSKPEFCNAFGGSSDSDSVCFNGKPIVLNDNETKPSFPPDGMCLEKISNGSYLNMVAHPDGSNRAFFSDQPGKIWLATIPQQDSGNTLGLDESSPFVDLSDQIYFGNKYGMMGLAFHPKFAENGRFFASYNCDKEKSSSGGCLALGRCACNSQVNCDPSKIVSSDAIQPCQIYSVVAEFSANGTSSTPSMAEKADPIEVRRIFSMGLPTPADHGGQILFNAKDGYMYYMMGDGGGKEDPYNFVQNKKSLLGKIMRLDVDNIPSEEEIGNLRLWGNYSVPRDNPYIEDKDMAPEVWAMGLRNPWRCSFDVERPSYFLCADIGQDRYEEVDLITKGGNYGWDVYEGPLVYNNEEESRKQNSYILNDSFNPIFPVVGYNHKDVNKKTGSAAINGGYIYRSTTTDPCMYGSYLYGDLYAQNIWAAMENPKSSGNFTATGIPFSCAGDSPIPCNSIPNSPLPALSYLFSFGEDNRKDVYLLTASGVYRVVRPSRCNYKCSKEIIPAAPTNTVLSSNAEESRIPLSLFKLFISFSVFYVAFHTM